MMKYLVFCCVLVLCCNVATNAASVKNRGAGNKDRFLHRLESTFTLVVGGPEAPMNSIPFIVSLRYNNEDWCGGSLVRVSPKNESDIVITAAHCVLNDEDLPTVHLGSHYRSQNVAGEEKIESAKIFRHSGYIHYSPHYDIAILKLKKPVPFTKTIQPVLLPKANDEVANGTLMTVAGWGRTENGSYSEVLRKVDIPIVEGRGDYDINLVLYAGERNKTTAQADSGGPLFRKNGKGDTILYGVVSGRYWDGSGLGMYVHVKNFRPWIIETIKTLSVLERIEID